MICMITNTDKQANNKLVCLCLWSQDIITPLPSGWPPVATLPPQYFDPRVCMPHLSLPFSFFLSNNLQFIQTIYKSIYSDTLITNNDDDNDDDDDSNN